VRRVVIVGLAGFALVLLASPAGAGGSSFSFPHRYYQSGEIARGRTSFSTLLDKKRAGHPDDGPWFAYLLENGVPLVPVSQIPRHGTELGRIHIIHAHRPLAIASVNFTVPNVPPGPYTIGVCNKPCRSQLGDLVGGPPDWRIVANPTERRLRSVVDRETLRTHRHIRKLEHLWHNTTKIYARAQEAEAAQSKRLAKLAARVRHLDTQRADFTVVPWALGVGLIVASSVAVLALRR
jgi:hypothetical protein